VALTADAAAGQARLAPTTAATASHEAGEPIMVIVSIMSQQVTFYDADVRTAGVVCLHIARRTASLRSVDEAIWRRFNLIPVTVTIPEEEREPELGAKLKAELQGKGNPRLRHMAGARIKPPGALRGQLKPICKREKFCRRG
jgi:hypothetical protein